MNETKNPLPALFSMVLLDQMASWMLLPILPLLFIQPASPFFLLARPEMAHTSGYILLGFLFAIFPFVQFFAAPILGDMSDSHGRKNVLLWASIFIAGGYMFLIAGAYMRNIFLIFLARAIAGIGGGSLGVVFASAADISTPQMRARNFGIVAAASGLGLVVGPLLGGVLSDSTILPIFNIMTPLWTLVTLAICNLAIVWFFFPETLQQKSSRTLSWGKPIFYIQKAFTSAGHRAVFSVSLLFSVCLALFVTFAPVLFYSRFAFSSSVLGYFLAYFGISVILTQVFLVPRIITLADDAVVLRDGLLSVFVGLLILYFAPSWHWLILGTPILALGTALSYTMITSLLSFRSESTDQGEVLGINTSVQSLGFALPGLFSGLIAAYLSAGAPIALAGTFVLFAAAIVFFSKELKPRKDTILK